MGNIFEEMELHYAELFPGAHNLKFISFHKIIHTHVNAVGSKGIPSNVYIVKSANFEGLIFSLSWS